MDTHTSPGRILVVGETNMVRSVYIERRLQQELDAVWGCGQFEVLSAGVLADNGDDMHPQVRAYLDSYGADSTLFASNRICVDEIVDADLVLVVNRALRTDVVRITPKALSKTFTLLDFADLASLAPESCFHELDGSDGAHRLQSALTLVRAMRGVRKPLEDDAASLPDLNDDRFSVRGMVDVVESAFELLTPLFQHPMVAAA